MWSYQTFDWQDFYHNWEGEIYFEWLRRLFNSFADAVLIDSRTGVTEMGGVCTYQFADVVVMMCAANNQNIDGTLQMIKSFSDSRLPELRHGRKLIPLIVPARVEESAEIRTLNEFRKKFSIFASHMPDELKGDLSLLVELEIPYVPLYAFEEIIAVNQTHTLERAVEMEQAYTKLLQVLSSFDKSLSIPGLDQQEPKVISQKTVDFYQKISEHFDEEELRTLCFSLGVDYDSLKGESKEGKVRELILYFERRNRIPELVELVKRLRPDAPWDKEALVEQYRNLKTRQLELGTVKTRQGPGFSAIDQAELLRVGQDLRRVERELKELGVNVGQLPLLDPRTTLLQPVPAPIQLVGYERELETARERLRQHGSLLITGLAGMGKTALGTTLAREIASEGRIFWFRFAAGLMDVETVLWNLAAFLDRLGYEELWRVLDGERTQTEILPHPLDIKLGLAAQGLNELGGVVCFDDYHLLPDPSPVCELLNGLMGRAKRYKVILMGRSRLSDVGRHSVLLSGLLLEATGELMAKLREEWSPAHTETLHHYLGGNPQLLEMFAAILAVEPEGQLSLIEKLDTLDDYPSIGNYLETELWTRLTSSERSVLQAISVFRQDAPRTVLEPVLTERGLSNIRTLLKRLQTWSIVKVSSDPNSGQRLYNIHETFKRFGYNMLDWNEQKEWHSAVGISFMESNSLEAAYHLFKAREYELSLTMMLDHKQSLLHTGHVSDALDILDQFTRPMFEAEPTRWVDVCELRGEWQQILGEYEDAFKSFGQALGLAEELGLGVLRQATLTRWLGVTRHHQGKLEEAERYLGPASQLLEGLEEPQEAELAESGIIYYWLARTNLRLGDMPEAVEYAERSVDRFSSISNRPWQIRAYAALATANLASGKIEVGAEYLDKARELFEVYGREDTPEAAEVYNDLGTWCFRRQEYEKGKEYYQRAVDIGQKIGLLNRVVLSSYNLGNLLTQTCAWDQAQDALELALRKAKDVGDTNYQVLALMGIGYNDHVCGKWEEAKIHFEQALQLAQEHKQIFREFQALIRLGQLHGDLDSEEDLRQGLSYLDQAWRIRSAPENGISSIEFDPEVLAPRAEIKAKLKDNLDGALQDAEQALEIAEQLKDKTVIGTAHMALGFVYQALGDQAQAEAALHKAEELLQPAPYQHGLALLRLGEIYSSSDKAKAESYLDRAVALFEDIDSKQWLELAKRKRKQLSP